MSTPTSGPMLRKSSTQNSGKTTPQKLDDEGKHRKVQRQQESRTKNALVFLGIICVVFLTVMVKLRHNHDMPKSIGSLRSHKRHDSLAVEHQHALPFIPPSSIYSLSVEDITGKMVSLNGFHGMVTLIVNVACLWGKTKVNYEQLALLQEKYKSQGFSVLAFPTNDFHQELSTNEDIQAFITANYQQVTFPVFGLTSLKDNVVYRALQQQLPNDHVGHNFFKYLVDRDGKAVKMFTKKQDPLQLTEEIEHLLKKERRTLHKMVTE